jgi:hypothetical protein
MTGNKKRLKAGRNHAIGKLLPAPGTRAAGIARYRRLWEGGRLVWRAILLLSC